MSSLSSSATTRLGGDMGEGEGEGVGTRHMDLPNAIIIKIIHEVQKSRAKDLKVHKEKMEKIAMTDENRPWIMHSLRGDIEMWRCSSCRAKSFMTSQTCFKCAEPNPENDYTFQPRTGLRDPDHVLFGTHRYNV